MYITVNDFTFQTIISWGTSQQKICVASIVQKPTQCCGNRFFWASGAFRERAIILFCRKKTPQHACTFGLRVTAMSGVLRLKVRGETWPQQRHSELSRWS